MSLTNKYIAIFIAVTTRDAKWLKAEPDSRVNSQFHQLAFMIKCFTIDIWVLYIILVKYEMYLVFAPLRLELLYVQYQVLQDKMPLKVEISLKLINDK